MKKSHQVSHRVLRTFVTIVAFLVIVASSVVYVEAKETEQPQSDVEMVNPQDIESIDVDRQNNFVTINKKDGTRISYNPKEQPQKVKIENQENIKIIGASTIKKKPCEDARRDQLYVTQDNSYNRPIYVVRCKDHTKVYVGARVLWNRHWFVLSKEMYLIDPQSRDKYMVHSSGTGLPLEKVIWLNDLKDKYIYFELIFPPLDNGVKRVDFKEWAKAATTEGYTNRGATVDHIGWNFPNIKVDKDLPYFVSEEFQAEQDKEPRIIKLDKNFELK